MDADKWCVCEDNKTVRSGTALRLSNLLAGRELFLDIVVAPCMKPYTMKDRWFFFQEP